jgi:hypothetical protein
MQGTFRTGRGALEPITQLPTLVAKRKWQSSPACHLGGEKLEATHVGATGELNALLATLPSSSPIRDQA